jgi:hypothetical protein
MPSTISPKEGAPAASPQTVPSRWYYSKNGKRRGPVSAAKLKDLLRTFEIAPDDRVIAHGMTEWKFPSEIQDLLVNAPEPAAVAPAEAMPAAPDPRPAIAIDDGLDDRFPTIPYYSAAGKLSPRAQGVLMDFPAPTGPAGESPLRDRHLTELRAAARHERALRQFNALCVILAWSSVVFFLLPTLLQMFFFSFGPMGPRGGSPITGMTPISTLFGLLLAKAVLVGVYFFAGRAALRARLWAPITVLSLACLQLIYIVYTTYQLLSRALTIFRSPWYFFSSGIFITLIPVLILIVILGIIIGVAVRATRAVPRFIDSPVWCQEALVVARA